MPTRLFNSVLTRRTVLTGVAATLGAHAARAAGSGLGLIMVDDAGCRYCRKFDAEIGGGYSRTAQGRFAPLVKVRRKSHELSNFNPVIYTPTFILVRRGDELGRISGYPGAEYFYAELDTLLAKAGFAPGLAPTPSGTRT